MGYTREQRLVKQQADEKADAERNAIITPLIEIAEKQKQIEVSEALAKLRENEAESFKNTKDTFYGERLGRRFWNKDEAIQPLTEKAIAMLKETQNVINIMIAKIDNVTPTQDDSSDSEPSSNVIWAIETSFRNVDELKKIATQLELLKRLEQQSQSKIYDMGKPKVGLEKYGFNELISQYDFDSTGKPNAKVQGLLDRAEV